MLDIGSCFWDCFGRDFHGKAIPQGRQGGWLLRKCVKSSTAWPRLYSSGDHDFATVLGSNNTVWFLYGICPVPGRSCEGLLYRIPGSTWNRRDGNPFDTDRAVRLEIRHVQKQTFVLKNPAPGTWVALLPESLPCAQVWW